MPASSRKYPFVSFSMDREPGKEIFFADSISKTIDGVSKVFDSVTFRVNKGDKIAFLSENELAVTTLFKIIMGEFEPDEGEFEWGISTSQSYFPKDNNKFFDGCELFYFWSRSSNILLDNDEQLCPGGSSAECCSPEIMC